VKWGLVMRGVSFEIPNKYGKQLLAVLIGFDFYQWYWRIGGGEGYIIENGTLGKDLIDSMIILSGDEFYKRISENEYYLFFKDLCSK